MKHELVNEIKFGDVDVNDFPDFCDAYIQEMTYDGKILTRKEIEEVDYDFFYDELLASLNM